MGYSSVGASLLAQVEVALSGGDAAPSPDAVPRMLDEADAALAKSLALFKVRKREGSVKGAVLDCAAARD